MALGVNSGVSRDARAERCTGHDMLASHLIFGAYGFWLPNDPRGSWSTFAGSWELLRFGAATKTTEPQSLAARPHDRGVRFAAKRALKRPAVEFSGKQALAISRGFARYAERSGLSILACTILPDHVHLVVGRHTIAVSRLIIQLKAAATMQLLEEELHPFAELPLKNGRSAKCFSRGGWKVYLDTTDDVHRAIQYVEANPLKEGKRPQRWSFVTRFEG
jgi:REP element-mobilizing transposase RayT